MEHESKRFRTDRFVSAVQLTREEYCKHVGLPLGDGDDGTEIGMLVESGELVPGKGTVRTECWWPIDLFNESFSEVTNKPEPCCFNCGKMMVGDFINTGCPFGKYNPIYGKYEQSFPPRVEWDVHADKCTKYTDRVYKGLETDKNKDFKSSVVTKRLY